MEVLSFKDHNFSEKKFRSWYDFVDGVYYFFTEGSFSYPTEKKAKKSFDSLSEVLDNLDQNEDLTIRWVKTSSGKKKIFKFSYEFHTTSYEVLISKIFLEYRVNKHSDSEENSKKESGMGWVNYKLLRDVKEDFLQKSLDFETSLPGLILAVDETGLPDWKEEQLISIQNILKKSTGFSFVEYNNRGKGKNVN
jgi:hypothetical protein